MTVQQFSKKKIENLKHCLETCTISKTCPGQQVAPCRTCASLYITGWKRNSANPTRKCALETKACSSAQPFNYDMRLINFLPCAPPTICHPHYKYHDHIQEPFCRNRNIYVVPLPKINTADLGLSSGCVLCWSGSVKLFTRCSLLYMICKAPRRRLADQ